jgi:hypothetical protein
MSHRCPSLDESYIAAPLAVFVTIGNTVKLHSKRLYSLEEIVQYSRVPNLSPV